MALGVSLATRTIYHMLYFVTEWKMLSPDAAGSGSLFHVLYLNCCCHGTWYCHGNQNKLLCTLFQSGSYVVNGRRWKWFSLLCFVSMALIIVMATRTIYTICYILFKSGSSWQETTMLMDAAGSGSLCYVLHLHSTCCHGTHHCHGNQNRIFLVLCLISELKLHARPYFVAERHLKWFLFVMFCIHTAVVMTLGIVIAT